MISRAVARYMRLSPRKTRLVTSLLKGRRVPDAFSILDRLNKRACAYVRDVLKSAVSNAKNKTGNADEGNLRISKIFVDEGPMLKRYRAASMGRATLIRKRTSHITIELSEIKAAVREAAGPAAAAKARKRAERPKEPPAPKKAKKEPAKAVKRKKAAAKA